MIEQPDLFGATHLIAQTGKPLTAKQQRAYDIAKTTPGGITADELGAVFHADRGKHHPDLRCAYCCQEGQGVLDSVALKPLLVRRRASGRYEPRDGSGTPAVADRGGQLVDGLPGSSWADIFGDAA